MFCWFKRGSTHIPSSAFVEKKEEEKNNRIKRKIFFIEEKI
jgi:hypothetical protein